MGTGPHPDPLALEAHLEPSAVHEWSSTDHPHLMIMASVAISLKRLADKVDGGQLDTHFFTDAAYHAGQAFERGRR